MGAYIVVSSTHKMAGSLTQSAMLHLGEGPLADRLEPLLDRAFRAMQSTSASALLMAYLDIARQRLVTGGSKAISESLSAAAHLRDGVTTHGRFLDASARLSAAEGVVALDPIVIDTRPGGLSGHEARERLFKENRVHLEMSTASVVVAVIGAGAAPDVERFLDALHALPEIGHRQLGPDTLPSPGPRAMSIRKAFFSSTEVVPARDAIGRVSADTLSAYPPGIPNLMAGEVITPEAI